MIGRMEGRLNAVSVLTPSSVAVRTSLLGRTSAGGAFRSFDRADLTRDLAHTRRRYSAWSMVLSVSKRDANRIGMPTHWGAQQVRSITSKYVDSLK